MINRLTSTSILKEKCFEELCLQTPNATYMYHLLLKVGTPDGTSPCDKSQGLVPSCVPTSRHPNYINEISRENLIACASFVNYDLWPIRFFAGLNSQKTLAIPAFSSQNCFFFSEWLNGESSLWDKNVVCKYFVKIFFTEILFYEDQHKISDNICSWSRCTKQVY